MYNRKDQTSSPIPLLKKQLSLRLAAKGLLDTEMHLYTHDILRILQIFPAIDLEKINHRLRLLGWNHEADYATVQLIAACHGTDLQII